MPSGKRQLQVGGASRATARAALPDQPAFPVQHAEFAVDLVLRQRTDEAERMIINLANFFRTSLTDRSGLGCGAVR